METPAVKNSSKTAARERNSDRFNGKGNETCSGLIRAPVPRNADATFYDIYGSN